jgi:DDE superfamily endonuclease
VFQDESGFSLLPPVRATWAPRGQTPVLRHRFSWKRLSMASALAYQPDGSQPALTFQIKAGSYNTGSLIGFLEDLRQHFAGAQVTLIWDNLPSHKSKAMTAWIASQASWLEAERLPGYAHDLNLPSGPNFDLAWQKNGTVFVAEVKSITVENEEQQLRLGLGQVLRYRQRLAALGYDPVVAVLVPERQPCDPSWRELCQDLGVVLLCRNELKRAPALDVP